jgi:excisionase family DNA binding protein
MIELDNKKYFTVKEVAEKLNVTIGRIAQLRRSGKLKSIKVSERKYLISEEAIKQYILFAAY